MSTERNESIPAELAADPFSPKRLRLLQALANAMFADPPADSAARQENDELIAAFAQLFFPGLPAEQARTHLAVMVPMLLDAAEEEERKGASSASSSSAPRPGARHGRAEELSRGHDWEKDPTGRGYLARLGEKHLNPRSAQQSEEPPQPSSERCSEGQGMSRTGLWYWL